MLKLEKIKKAGKIAKVLALGVLSCEPVSPEVRLDMKCSPREKIFRCPDTKADISIGVHLRGVVSDVAQQWIFNVSKVFNDS